MATIAAGPASKRKRDIAIWPKLGDVILQPAASRLAPSRNFPPKCSMAQDEIAGGSADPRAAGGLRVQLLALHDIAAVLALGWHDFRSAPMVSIAIASIYTLGGWLLAALLTVFDLPFLVYPLAMGFALIAPFIAVAFYDVSHRLESETRPTLGAVWRATRASARRDIRWMALITAFAFFLWMDMAAMLTLSFFGAAALDFRALLNEIFTSTRGLLFLVVGHIAGAIVAGLIFAISVVSFPLLYDRDIDVVSAITASIRLVRQNPIPMLAWCVTIAASIVIAIASGLLLLPVLLPILGYATWHLYRRSID